MYSYTPYTPPNIGTPFLRALTNKLKNPWEKLKFEREPEPESEPEQSSVMDTLMQIRNRKSPVMSEYEKYLQEGIPENTGRSGWAKAAAVGLAGLGSALGDSNAPESVMKAYNSPYERELDRYENRGKTLAAAVTLENARNRQDSDISRTMLDYELKKVDDKRDDLRFGETNRSNLERERLAGERENKRLTEAERIRQETEGRTNLASSNAISAMERVSANNTAAMERVMQQGRNQSAAIDQRAATKDKNGVTGNDLDFLRGETGEALKLIDELYDSKNDKLSDLGARATGKSSIGNWIPTTEGYTGKAKINSLKNKLTLTILQAMKQASKTGATGFGQLSIKELGVLENAASILDTGLSEEAFMAEVKKIKERLERVMVDESSGNTAARAQAMIKKYGGG